MGLKNKWVDLQIGSALFKILISIVIFHPGLSFSLSKEDDFKKRIEINISAVNLIRNFGDFYKGSQLDFPADEVGLVEKFLVKKGIKPETAFPKFSLKGNKIYADKIFVAALSDGKLIIAHGATIKYDRSKSFDQNFLKTYQLYFPEATFSSLLFINQAHAGEGDKIQLAATNGVLVGASIFLTSLAFVSYCGPVAAVCTGVSAVVSTLGGLVTGVYQYFELSKISCTPEGIELAFDKGIVQFKATKDRFEKQGQVIYPNHQKQAIVIDNEDLHKSMKNLYHQACELGGAQEISQHLKENFKRLIPKPSLQPAPKPSQGIQ